MPGNTSEIRIRISICRNVEEISNVHEHCLLKVKTKVKRQVTSLLHCTETLVPVRRIRMSALWFLHRKENRSLIKQIRACEHRVLCSMHASHEEIASFVAYLKLRCLSGTVVPEGISEPEDLPSLRTDAGITQNSPQGLSQSKEPDEEIYASEERTDVAMKVGVIATEGTREKLVDSQSARSSEVRKYRVSTSRPEETSDTCDEESNNSCEIGDNMENASSEATPEKMEALQYENTNERSYRVC